MAREIAGWHAENIKAELRKVHGSVRSFAAVIEVSPQWVSDVMNGRNSSAKIERAIAAAIGVSPHSLWPERWTVDGLKIDWNQTKRNLEAERTAA